jgi:hypothetical protein
METIMTGNRYLIYKLLGREITCDPQGFGRKVKPFSGVVEKVSRDIFDNMVIMTVSGQRYSLQEPTTILEGESSLMFVYGTLEEFDDSDETLFNDIRASAYGDSVIDVVRRTPAIGTKTLSFDMGPKAQPRKAWSRRRPDE